MLKYKIRLVGSTFTKAAYVIYKTNIYILKKTIENKRINLALIIRLFRILDF